jgi:hypothetical protein
MLTGAPRQCVLVVASHVPGEWAAHASDEADNLRKHLAQYDEDGERFHEIAGLVGVPPRQDGQANAT